VLTALRVLVANGSTEGVVGLSAFAAVLWGEEGIEVIPTNAPAATLPTVQPTPILFPEFLQSDTALTKVVEAATPLEEMGRFIAMRPPLPPTDALLELPCTLAHSVDAVFGRVDDATTEPVPVPLSTTAEAELRLERTLDSLESILTVNGLLFQSALPAATTCTSISGTTLSSKFFNTSCCCMGSTAVWDRNV